VRAAESKLICAIANYVSAETVGKMISGTTGTVDFFALGGFFPKVNTRSRNGVCADVAQST
jgi:hypothetical protein